jgi:hypothetical protein
MVEITRFMKRADGSYNLGVTVGDTVRVLVEPVSVDAQADAEKTASFIGHQTEEIARLEQKIIELRDALTKARTSRKTAESALDAALSGKRRFFGRVMMKPAMPGDWTGEVWLLDPEKQERGWGMRFQSTADVRREYPELWPVGKTHDGILLDACPLGQKDA